MDISPLIPIVLSILGPIAISTTDIEDAVKSALTCVGVNQKSYECLVDYNVEGYLFVFHVKNGFSYGNISNIYRLKNCNRAQVY